MQTNPFRAALALGAFALCGLTSAAHAQDYTFFPNDTTINYAVNTSTNAIVGYASGTFGNFQLPSSPTVGIVSGGSVGDTYSYNASTVNLSGGFGGGLLRAYDTSTVNLSKGSVGRLQARDASTINMTGGSVGNYLEAFNDSTINLSGGTVGLNLTAFDSGVLNIFGVNLTAPLINANASDPAYGIPSSLYSLSGTLRDGTVYTNKSLYVQNGTGASFHLFNSAATPAPSSVLVIAMGAVPLVSLLRRRRK